MLSIQMTHIYIHLHYQLPNAHLKLNMARRELIFLFKLLSSFKLPYFHTVEVPLPSRSPMFIFDTLPSLSDLISNQMSHLLAFTLKHLFHSSISLHSCGWLHMKCSGLPHPSPGQCHNTLNWSPGFQSLLCSLHFPICCQNNLKAKVWSCHLPTCSKNLQWFHVVTRIKYKFLFWHWSPHTFVVLTTFPTLSHTRGSQTSVLPVPRTRCSISSISVFAQTISKPGMH